MSAQTLFEMSLDQLRQTYFDHQFFVERDVVQTLQKRLITLVSESDLPLRVYNDYPMLPGNRRSLSADICLVDLNGDVKLAAEFKYEPSHTRKDILKHKPPVVFWGMDGVGKDVIRIRKYVELNRETTAYSIFIDEGGAFHSRAPHPGSRWVDWGNGIWVLLSKVEISNSPE